MLGREHEQRAVEAVIADAHEGRAASLLLVGLPGIGKTTLLDHAEQHATALGMTAYRITAVEAESGVPGSGLSLLRPLLGAGNLSDPWTLLRALSELAVEHPLVLVLDDVQWLDEASLAALGFVARRLVDDAIALVMAARPEIDDDAQLLDVPRLPVEPLAPEDAAALLQSVSPSTPHEVATALAGALGNVPLALVEAPALLSPDVLAGRSLLPSPMPVGRSVAARYARGVDALPANARWALVLASSEDSGDPTVLAAALDRAGLGTSDLLPAIEGGLLLPGAGVAFRHPLVRAAVHSSATDAERRRAHSILASVHAQAGDEELELRHAAAASLGTDEVLAARLEAAVPVVVARRGRTAGGALALTAAELSARPGDRWRRLVTAVELQRISPIAASAAREIIERCSNPELRARAALVLADLHLPPGEDVALLDEAVSWVRPGPVWEDVQDYRVLLCLSSEDRPALESICAELEQVRQVRDLSWLLEYLLGLLHLELGRPEEAAPLARAALEHSHHDPPEAHRAEFMWEWVRIPVMMEERDWDSPVVLDRLRAASALLRAARNPEHTAIADLLEVQRSFGSGELARAESVAHSSLSLGPQIGPLQVPFLRYLTQIAARQGRPAATLERIEEFRLVDEDRSDRPPFLRASLGLVHLLQGDASAALDSLRTARVPQNSNPEGVPILLPALEIEALTLLDRTEEAIQLARDYEVLVDGLPSPRIRSIARRCSALVQPDPASELWDEAVALGRQSTDIWELARTLLLQGERLRRDRRLSEARDPLREAADLFRRCGAEAWAARAENELAAAGGTATQAARTTMDLTPQELRIALAVAEGLSNNDIAGTVFLSVKTVETHLTRIYRKLGVRSRGGVAKALADAGIAA